MPSRTLLCAASAGCILAVVGCGKPTSERAAPVASVAPVPTPSAAPPPAPPASVPAAIVAKPGAPAGMSLVPGGIFWMGEDHATEEEAPRHRVAVRTFAMDVHELTVADYAACVAAGACTAAHSDHALCNTGHADRSDHPINCID